MGGPNLEVFKFSLYLFFPLATLVHYSNPRWYQEHVVPVRALGCSVDDQLVYGLL